MANEFLPFATGSGANVQSQAAYDANADREDGNQPGIASSALNNKAIRQGTFVASQVAALVAERTGVDALDNGVEARFLSQLKASVLAYPPTVTSYTSGSGTHYITYLFFIASGSATASATYTNNGFTFTVKETIASGTVLRATGTGAPSTSGTLTKSGGTGDTSITFYSMRAPVSLLAEGVGGGGGGAGGQSNGSGGSTGGTGGNTTFGSCSANGGSGGSSAVSGAGGTASITGATGTTCSGGAGGGAGYLQAAFAGNTQGGMGGNSHFGGGGGTTTNGNGLAAATNTGGGGGGGGAAGGASITVSGAGGGAGGYFSAIYTTIAASYSYAVGSAGTAGAIGSGLSSGGAGAAGSLLVVENYQ